MQYFSWADGEPNGATDEKICIQLKGVPSSEFDNYDWNDESCGVSNPFICEFGKEEKDVSGSNVYKIICELFLIFSRYYMNIKL